LGRLGDALSQGDVVSSSYESVFGLVQVFDERKEEEGVKAMMLQVFSLISTLDPKWGSLLASSPLPLILMKDLYNRGGDIMDVDIAHVLTTLFTSSSLVGERLPESHLASEGLLGRRFVAFVLKAMNNGTPDPAFLSLLLAYYNLQFQFSSPEEESLINTMNTSRDTSCQYLIASLIRLFEEEESSSLAVNVNENGLLLATPPTTMEIHRDDVGTERTRRERRELEEERAALEEERRAIHQQQRQGWPTRSADTIPYTPQPKCQICLQRPRNVIILPCRHFGLCDSCADRIPGNPKNCPFCRHIAGRTEKVFFV